MLLSERSLKEMFNWLLQVTKSDQKLLVQEPIINKCSRDSLSCLQNVHNGEFARPILWRKELVVKYLFKILYWNFLDLVTENIKRQFINVVPINAYIRKLFFKSSLRSWSGFISCSNFRINILGKDALDLYDLVSKIEFNLIIPQKSFTTFGSARCQGFSPLSW